jgi:hypothetical protein
MVTLRSRVNELPRVRRPVQSVSIPLVRFKRPSTQRAWRVTFGDAALFLFAAFAWGAAIGGFVGGAP